MELSDELTFEEKKKVYQPPLPVIHMIIFSLSPLVIGVACV